ncbi:GyrI-like domain-containing protein [Marivirga atlantica]|jgi:predicted transcriptional regulator YdeE|uniref:Effector binding domain-containing protein n=1 Tax=Marivirga atlantica TaxID=1548457 RepID=A0A937AHU9_9BACT|nr:effector binding domain-containing protein [Marivirga atlantica]MBL0766709.1 effector binding domain-containing protein [Marivirga atlantica]
MQKVKIDPFQIIGISVRTTNKNDLASEQIAALWGEFLEKNLITQIPNKVDDTIYSLYTEYEGDYTQPYTAILGCKVHSLDNIPEGMLGKSFSGGDYVKTTAKGDLMNGLIVNHWNSIFEMNLDRKYTADFEVFGEKAQDKNNAEVDFYVAVK